MTGRIIRPSEVTKRTGISRVTIWRKVRSGDFPPPIELGPNAIGWPDDTIETWLNNRPIRTYREIVLTDTVAGGR
jgi:prophage regulatory protein